VARTPRSFGREILQRPVLVSYDNYEQAQAAVDKLSDEGFPVRNVAIVGVDLKLVESVLGRLSWGRAALGGMGTGAWFGLLIGLFVSLFASGQESGSWTLIVAGLLYGAAFGIVFGLISYGLTGGRRDFVSRQALQAARYDILVEAPVMAQARSVLFGGAAWPPPLPAPDETPGGTPGDRNGTSPSDSTGLTRGSGD